MKNNKMEVEVGSHYKSPKTKYGFKVIVINRKENYCCIVDKNKRNETIPLDDINSYLAKGKIEKASTKILKRT